MTDRNHDPADDELDDTCVHCGQPIRHTSTSDGWETVDGDSCCPVSDDPASWGIHTPELSPEELWRQHMGYYDISRAQRAARERSARINADLEALEPGATAWRQSMRGRAR